MAPMTTSENSNPSPFWSGAATGVTVGAIGVSALTATFLGTGLPRIVEALAGALAGLVVVVAVNLASRALVGVVSLLPRRFLYVLLGAIGAFAVMHSTRFRWDPSSFYLGVSLFLLAQACLFGAVSAWRGGHPRRGAWGILVLLAVAIYGWGIWWLGNDGHDPYPVEPTIATTAPDGIDAPDPAEMGSYDVETLTYGSGTDKRRPEFGDDVTLTTSSVDASKLLPEWTGFKARARDWYWGISLEQAPLNARVWMPVGDGPFPLTLIVHGNHGMEDHSDEGYAYLGELLASRGIIMASVDENYINGTWSGDFGGREMPLRGWLLLEHLRVWRDWNQTSGHRLEGKVDFEKLGLMGHSRGGEALGIAAAFNELSHFPDDATLPFDYGFDIKALVSIAQIDKRYIRRPELENVNFLALQGSYDSDEASFHGLRQFRRIRFTDDNYWFKAGIYVHGGNHGQFNTDWGRYDSGRPGKWMLNVAPMISGEDQRRIAKVYISAFLEATLLGDERYLPLFQDPRAGKAWLPESMISLHQFDDSTFTAVADFEEDIDVTTASLPGSRIEVDGLDVWREKELLFRDRLTQSTNAVSIGSNGEQEGSYVIHLGPSPPAIHAESVLAFFMSTSPETVDPSDADESEDASEPAEQAESLAISVQLEDASGNEASVLLSDVAPVTPPLRIQFLKLSELNEERYTNTWEPSLSSYSLPMSLFPGVVPEQLSTIRFRAVDGAGVVVLDEIGFRHPRESAPLADEEVELVRDVDEAAVR